MPEALAPRRQHAGERREQILDVATRVFAEKGFAGASIRDIANAVGVTEGLLYHYFESKEQILHACWSERSWRAHLERILAQSGDKPLAAVLQELVEDFMQTLRDNSDMVRMCAVESQRDPEIASWHRQRIQSNQRLLSDFLLARVQAGEIRPDADMETASGLLMGCAYSCFLLFSDSHDETWSSAVHSVAHNGVDVVMRGLTPR